jgi:hypothetical protein
MDNFGTPLIDERGISLPQAHRVGLRCGKERRELSKDAVRRNGMQSGEEGADLCAQA